MKNVLLSLFLSFTAIPLAHAQSDISLRGQEVEDLGTQGDDDLNMGVSGGGAGGTPRTFETNSLGRGRLEPRIDRRPTSVLMGRQNMLRAIDAALNARDLRMQIEEKEATVRLESLDLKAGVLHGKVLETNKPVLLLDQSKATGR